MRKIELEELKQIQLDILKEVHNFCVEHGLRYSLGGGTLLGAVRHKGYIPWDDDIDIMMPRPDYTVFVKEFNGYKPHLVCGAYENDKKYMYPFTKVYDNRTILKAVKHIKPIGINIDVFPIDGFPESEKETEIFMRNYSLWRMLLYFKLVTGGTWKGKFMNFFTKLLPLSLIQKKLNKIIQKYDFEKSLFTGAVCGSYLLKEKNPKFVFAEYVELPFENLKFKAIKQYDIYLLNHYGNYMELPPMDKRIAHHIEETFWKE